LAVLGNLVRILMLTLGTIAFGSEFALGKNPLEHPSWFHMLAGYLVFIVALAGMMEIASLLARLPGNIRRDTPASLSKQSSPPVSESDSSDRY
jgi:hypothetical protein